MNVTRDRIVRETRTWIGTPYLHQASAKGIGCDCLGLVRGIWRTFYGDEPEKAPAYSADWAETSGVETLLNAALTHLVAVDEPLPGDVLVFRWRPHLPAKHVAMLVTAHDPKAGRPGRIVHAYQAAGRVTEGHLQPDWDKRIAGAFAFPGVLPGTKSGVSV